MKQDSDRHPHAGFGADHGPPHPLPRKLGVTLLQVLDFTGFGLWMLLGLALAIGVYPAGRGDALVPLAIGCALVGMGLAAACLRLPWMPAWHGWSMGSVAWPTRDALVALATVLPMMAVAGLARGDNTFWATRLSGAALALCSLVSIILTSYSLAKRSAPGLEPHFVAQLPLSRVLSATYAGALWVWLCMAGQDNVGAAEAHSLPWVVGVLMLALLRGLVEGMRWQTLLLRLPTTGTRFELQPRRYLAAFLIYAMPSAILLAASFDLSPLPLALLAPLGCMLGMGLEVSLYDGALAALPDSR